MPSQFASDRFLFEEREACLQIVGQRGGMVERASVQPEAARLVAPGLVNGPLQEPFSETLADELARQPELDEFNLARLPTIEFCEAGRSSSDVQHVQFIEGMLNDGSELLVRHLAATEPMELATDGVVESPIVLHCRYWDVPNAQSLARSWHRSTRVAEHFEVIDGDVNDLQESVSVRP